jgi:trimeric autotransporter adhesin
MERKQMRSAAIWALVAAVLLALTAGTAMALTISCPGEVDFEVCEGTNGDDTMNGTSSENHMNALAGNDTLNGFDGEDNLVGGPGNDALNGFDRDDYLRGDSGKDIFSGGPQNDQIDARAGDEDQINCGTGGADQAYFDRGLDTVKNCELRKWSPDGATNQDGCPDDWDNLREKCIEGDEANNELVGTNKPQVFLDFVNGYGGDDTLSGRRGIDGLAGWSGDDTLRGGMGVDALFGDDPEGDFDPDVSGNDELYGGRGDDYIFANDGKQDVISCGPGDHDQVLYDSGIDVRASDCEFTIDESIGRHWWRSVMGRRR